MEEMTIVSNNPNIIAIVFIVLIVIYLIFTVIRIFIDLKRKKQLETIAKEIKEKKE